MHALRTDERLYHVGTCGDLWKPLRSVGEVEAVGNPWHKVDAPRFDEPDDFTEVIGQRISAGEQRQFTAVEVRIVEIEITLKQADEDNTAPLRAD